MEYIGNRIFYFINNKSNLKNKKDNINISNENNIY